MGYSEAGCQARHFYTNWALGTVFGIALSYAVYLHGPFSPFNKINDKLDNIAERVTRIETKLDYPAPMKVALDK